MASTLWRLSKDHAQLNWLFVYTLEAHAQDEWPISSSRFDPSGAPVCIRQHRTMAERLQAARDFRTAFQVPFPIVADTIRNEFEDLFCTWPFRFYVLHKGLVIFQAQPNECTYSIESLVQVLQGFD